MTLYKPVFPPTNARVLHASSSSSSLSSSSDAPHPPTYTEALFQLHHTLAALPEELCAPSRPSSPASLTRRADLERIFSECIRKGRYVGDYYHLSCVQPRVVWNRRVPEPDQEEDNAETWKLAETEEEWFEFEKERERRARSAKEAKGKEKAVEQVTEQTAVVQEKVFTWQASLTTTLNSVYTSEALSNVVQDQAKLNFKASKSASALSATTRKSTKSKAANARKDGKRAKAPSGTKRKNPLSGSSGAAMPSHPTSAAAESHQAARARRLSEPSSPITLHQLPDAPELPEPSFNSQLMTSTQTSEGHGGQGLAGLHDANTGQGILNRMLVQYSSQSSHYSELLRKSHSTPLSPPPSSNSSEVINGVVESVVALRHPSDMITEDVVPPVPPAHPVVRPLTPSPDRPFNPPSLDRPHKRSRTMHSPFVAPNMRDDGQPVHPPSPQPQEPSSSPVPAELGNARRISTDNTPQRQPPAENVGLLASSRRSLPRPRPPPRHTIPPVLSSPHRAHVAEQMGSPPTKLYLSSPASGSTMSTATTPATIRHRPDFPESPLFSQDPTRFAPLSHSTQPLVDKSPLHDRVMQIRTGGNLSRQSSGLVGMAYSSQFDVESRVDRFNHMMDNDVDFSAWLRDVNDEEPSP